MPPPLKLADSLRRRPAPLLVLFEQTECAACDEMYGEAFRCREVAALLRRLQVERIDMGELD